MKNKTKTQNQNVNENVNVDEYTIVDISDKEPAYDKDFLIEKIAQYELANEKGLAKLLMNRTSTVRGIKREFPSKWNKELIEKEMEKAKKEFEEIKDIEGINESTDEFTKTKFVKKTTIGSSNCYGDDIYTMLSTNISIKSNYTIMWVVIRNYKINQMKQLLINNGDWDIAEEMLPLVKEELMRIMRQRD